MVKMASGKALFSSRPFLWGKAHSEKGVSVRFLPKWIFVFPIDQAKAEYAKLQKP
jgi:hypothetical protein